MVIAGTGKADGQFLAWGTSVRTRVTPPGSGAAGLMISAQRPHLPPLHIERYARQAPEAIAPARTLAQVMSGFSAVPGQTAISGEHVDEVEDQAGDGGRPGGQTLGPCE